MLFAEAVPFLYQPIRDLAWLITAPPVMADGTPGLPQPPPDWLADAARTAAPWLQELDDQPKELQRYLAQLDVAHGRHFRLGRQAERLLAFWLAHRPGGSLLATGVQVREGLHVLGELDLVFRDPARGLLHWEAAVKFYLRAEASSALDAYRGPNPRDSLGAKVGHLARHQLLLAHDPRAREALGLGDEPLRSEAFLRGWLFYPADGDWQQPAFTPTGVHPDHPHGWWLRHGASEIPCAARSSRFLLPARHDWLAPLHRPDDGGVRPLAHGEVASALARHFHAHHDPRLVCELRRDGEGWWQEIARGFVVHPHWPEIVHSEDQRRP